MKLHKASAGGIIFAALLLFLFFSKTIYTYNMPEVSGVKPGRGSLSKLEISSGIARWAETENIYAAAGGAGGDVFVKEGDRVEQGQILFAMDYDIAAARRRLEETENNIAKTENEIRNIQSKLDGLREALGAAKKPEELGGQAGIIGLEISKARLTMENAKLSFELGSASGIEALNAENTFKALLLKYEVEAAELEFSLASKQIDLRNLRLAEEAAGEILRDYRNNSLITAPAAGVVTAMNVEKGRYFAENAALASIGVGREFTVECTVSLDNNFISAGDQCDLSNSARMFKGTVTRVKPSAQGKTVSVAISSSGINGVSEGETFTITFEKRSASSFTLVNTGAVNQDSDGYFLYRIKRRKGIMGEEYYVERLDVFPGDSDYRNTVIVRGITFFEPVVLSSDKPLSAGIAVRLKNPGDFFEN